MCTFSFSHCILYYNRNKNIKLLYKKEGNTMTMKSPLEFFRTLPKKTCPECGEQVEEQAESYFMECERCLAKKGE